MAERDLADPRPFSAEHDHTGAALPDRLQSLRGEQTRQVLGPRAAHHHSGLQPGPGELADRLVSDQPPPVDPDHVIGERRHLPGVIARHHDRAALVSEGPQQ
ncbi:hypothetical protein [Wenjunlia vitaminophila]|uniref:hypothetical protein n=1 Tax=Wenjunlia vitaminophila TaxID=76728 RepID=UPI001F27E818|nr:hypothetical protein [Wenjunlia vitaminophila]